MASAAELPHLRLVAAGGVAGDEGGRAAERKRSTGQRGMNAIPSALPQVRLLPLGDAALTVEFGSVIEPSIRARVLGFASALQKLAASGQLAGVIEWVPTFRSVTGYFDPDRLNGDALADKLLALAPTTTSLTAAGAHRRLPGGPDAGGAPALYGPGAAKALAGRGRVQCPSAPAR